MTEAAQEKAHDQDRHPHRQHKAAACGRVGRPVGSRAGAATRRCRIRARGSANNKVAGFVGYGSAGGTRAVESLRLVMAELQIATVRSQVALSLFTDFEEMRTFKPASRHEKPLDTMLDQIIAWGSALKTVRER
jgi:NAD(P)H-dependent FMN reductase